MCVRASFLRRLLSSLFYAIAFQHDRSARIHNKVHKYRLKRNRAKEMYCLAFGFGHFFFLRQLCAERFILQCFGFCSFFSFHSFFRRHFFIRSARNQLESARFLSFYVASPHPTRLDLSAFFYRAWWHTISLRSAYNIPRLLWFHSKSAPQSTQSAGVRACRHRQHPLC